MSDDVKIQNYSMSESFKPTPVNLFDLELDNLVFEKMFILFEVVQPLQKKINKFKMDIKSKEDDLLRTLDFKQELNITTKPTVKEKEAVINQYLTDDKNKLLDLEAELVFYKDKLVIINDLIKNSRLLLELEGNLVE